MTIKNFICLCSGWLSHWSRPPTKVCFCMCNPCIICLPVSDTCWLITHVLILYYSFLCMNKLLISLHWFCIFDISSLSHYSKCKHGCNLIYLSRRLLCSLKLAHLATSLMDYLLRMLKKKQTCAFFWHKNYLCLHLVLLMPGLTYLCYLISTFIENYSK